MIFQHTWEKVLSGEKTQTRRLFKAGDYGWMCGYSNEIDPTTGRTGFIYSSVSNQQDGKIINRWLVGKTYAIQPGRGMKAVGRIQIIGIRCQDVRKISLVDVRAEGFEARYQFLDVWAAMHDPYMLTKRAWFDEWSDRPSDLYRAWVLHFSVVK